MKIVTIYDNTGRLINSEDVNFGNLILKEFNLKNNPSGIYFIRIKDSGGNIDTFKIVKE
jgi:hypothetical protein